jgi:hypothetical protein
MSDKAVVPPKTPAITAAVAPDTGTATTVGTVPPKTPVVAAPVAAVPPAIHRQPEPKPPAKRTKPVATKSAYTLPEGVVWGTPGDAGTAARLAEYTAVESDEPIVEAAAEVAPKVLPIAKE